MPPPNPKTNSQSRAFSIRIAATTAAVAVLALARSGWLGRRRASNLSLIGGPFALEDGAGKTITDQTLRGRPFLVYFGYTHCPDVCPTELAHISRRPRRDGRQGDSCSVHHSRSRTGHA